MSARARHHRVRNDARYVPATALAEWDVRALEQIADAAGRLAQAADALGEHGDRREARDQLGEAITQLNATRNLLGVPRV